MAENTEITAENWLDGLDDRERIFVVEYLKSLNVKRSAIKAGYSEIMAMTTAYLWVSPPTDAEVSNSKRKPKVYRAVQFGLEQRRRETLVTADMVVRELKSIAFADPRELMAWDTTTETEEDSDDGGETLVVRKIVSNSVRLKSSDAISDEMASAIKEIRQNQDGSITIKLHDKRAALADLGKHLGIMDDRVRHLGPTGGPVEVISAEMDPQEAARLWQASIDGE